VKGFTSPREEAQTGARRTAAGGGAAAGAQQGAAALAGSSLLAAVAPADLQALARAGRVRSWRPGGCLFQRGDPGDGIYAVIAGVVRIVLEGEGGSEVVVRTLRDGEVFGELSVLDGAPRTATALASGAVTALHISAPAFEAWLRERPEAMLALLRQLAYRLRTTNEQVAEIGLLDVETRVLRRLWRRFTEASADGAPAAGQRLRVNQTLLAAELGVTRESVNKHLARLKARGLIALDRGDVTLLDVAGLRLALPAV